MRYEIDAMAAAIIRLERGASDRATGMEILRQHLVRLTERVSRLEAAPLTPPPRSTNDA